MSNIVIDWDKLQVGDYLTIKVGDENVQLKVVSTNKRNKDVFEMSADEFKAELSARTTPEEVFEHAKEIYTFLSGLFEQICGDSVLREWAFQWWSEETGLDYKIIYERWLDD